jgi:hypothetical protein
MCIEEANAVLDAINENYRDAWEQTRFLAYIQSLSNGAKLHSPLDVIKFSWDADIAIDEISDEELQQRKQSMLDFIQGGKSLKEFNPLLKL